MMFRLSFDREERKFGLTRGGRDSDGKIMTPPREVPYESEDAYIRINGHEPFKAPDDPVFRVWLLMNGFTRIKE